MVGLTVSDREARKVCAKIANGTKKPEDFSDFADHMASATFRGKASRILEEYRGPQCRGLSGCFTKPNATTVNEKATHLQAAIDRVMKGGWLNDDGPNARLSNNPALAPVQIGESSNPGHRETRTGQTTASQGQSQRKFGKDGNQGYW